MDLTLIAESLAPFLGGEELSSRQLDQVSAYLDLLLKWNAKMNLTGIRKPEEIIARHFGESFFAASKLLGAAPAASAIDLGSGAGFPGLPLAIYAREIKMTLIESHDKKATFLKEVVRSLGLRNVSVFGQRGEDYPGHAALVLLRAVEKFPQAVKVAAGMVEPGGRLALMAGMVAAKHLPSGFAWKVGEKIPESDGRMLTVGILLRESKK